MIYLDGRGLLHQWDVGREVAVCDAECDQVHFAQSGSRCGALVVEVRKDGDEAIAEVPNCLLVSGSSVDIWAVADGVVTDSKRLPVLDRPKPNDYAYTPTEVLNYASMKEWVVDTIEGLSVSPTDYRSLGHLPSICGHVLIGDNDLSKFGIETTTNDDIDEMFKEDERG